ncbi:hypothetical protein GALMADRAFT_1293897 [Galerina marginata CBS 339.88]|uniref:Uncharacterized protein n=1 Tax=Galerina marginata (strain CBS 339.88) TaxID=685588 RepID=A0A067T433_GALM3|nr:hypothetical protein GALMADRAFT_1293897 [Galerina marginata CBS 339.88]
MTLEAPRRLNHRPIMYFPIIVLLSVVGLLPLHMQAAASSAVTCFLPGAQPRTPTICRQFCTNCCSANPTSAACDGTGDVQACEIACDNL